MGGIIQGVAKAFGTGLALGIGKTLVFVVIAFMFFFLASALLGVFAMIFSFKFYKSGKPVAFLISGILSVLSISIFISILLSSRITNGLTLAVILFPILFIFGMVFVVKKYRKIKHGGF